MPYDNLPRELLSLLPSKLPRVLEFGCATGRLAWEYRLHNEETIWHGVDTDQEALKIAASRASHVYCDDALNFLKNHDIGDFDCIILADILEHLEDPFAFLQTLVMKIRAGSRRPVIYISIPNVQHWSVLCSLLLGEFHRTDEGILDRTHRHFWTIRTFVSMLQNLGLSIKTAIPLIPKKFNPICGHWEFQNQVLNLSQIFLAHAKVQYNSFQFEAVQFLFEIDTQIG